MDLIQQLYTTVTPLRDVVVVDEHRRTRHDNTTTVAVEVRHQQTVTKYRNAMGSDWVSTKTITDRLGYGRYAIYDTLHSWETLKILERRKVGGEKGWSMKRGYEWRFIK